MSTERPNQNDSPNISDVIPQNKVQALLLAHKLLNGVPLGVQLFLAVVGLVVASYFGWQLCNTLFNDQENLARTLGATIVSTAYPHRGVTAFLVADLDKNLPAGALNNDDLKTAVGKIHSDITELTNAVIKEPKTFDRSVVLKDLKLTVVDDKSKNKQRDIDSTWKKAVISKTIKEKGGYLMVPAISLRQAQVADNVLKEGDEAGLRKVLENNPEVLFDLDIAKKIDDKLKALGDLTNQQLKIVQAYFISESGVILLRALPRNMSYDQTFPTNTLFMDRLYFWGGIEPDAFLQGKPNGPLDYQTDPYIDLGGNGVVKTYSKRVELPNHRSGVICVDVVLPDAMDQIRERLMALGAKVDESSYTSGKDHLEAENGQPIPKAFDWVNYQLKNQAQSRITGAVAFQSDFPNTAKDGVVRFTLPIGSQVAADQQTVTRLLLVTFDFRSIKWWILIYSLAFLAGILLVVFVMWNLLWHYARLKRDMTKVLENMSTVMYDAATPFAWLNERNEFYKVNRSFLQTVGCQNDHELKNHAPTFRDLLTADSQRHYETILEQSGRGERTPKYRIEIIKQNKDVIPVWAHGERIPYPTLGRRQHPHRFGVFLPGEGHHEGGPGNDHPSTEPER